MAPTTMALRFRDLLTEGTIRRHRDLIARHGYVWWGWWDKPGEPVPRNTFAHFQQEIQRVKGLPVYLVDSGSHRCYMALLTRIQTTSTEEPIPSPDPSRVPSYYRTRRCKAWFRFERIRDAEASEVREYSYDEVDEYLVDATGDLFRNKRCFSVEELLSRHRTIYFLQPYREFHPDYHLRLVHTKLPSNFIVERPVARDSTFVLHLSDLHFGPKHRFETRRGRVNRNLAALIVQDVRRVYGGMAPAALIISGDLTWSGEPNEFEQAASFVRQLCSDLALGPEHLIIVPGNHDVQWSNHDHNDYDRSRAVERPREEAEANYRTFYRGVFGLPATPYLQLARRYLLANWVTLDIVGLNSSRLEQRHFAGYGYVSSEQLDEAAQTMNWSDERYRTMYRMLVLHHHVIPVTPREEITTYDRIYSLTLDAGQLTYKALELEVDLIGHGHMHQPFATSLSRAIKGNSFPSMRSVGVVGVGSGGVQRDYLGDVGKNSFTIYEFDPNGVTVHFRSWSEHMEGFESDWGARFIRVEQGGLRVGDRYEPATRLSGR
jgi:3',5'-cyclic AMP phosphodiesterase CpdA